MKEAPIIPRRQMGFQAHVGKEFSGAFLIVILLLLTFTLVLPSPRSIYPRAFDHAYAPVTIASGSMPLKPTETVTDWFDALNWMRNNESVTIVASWWDYGYWIRIIGNKTTLADNGTLNMTQIEQIAWMFLLNETKAIEILSRYQVTHVVVFNTFDTGGNDIGWGEESKWRWMARISERWTGLNDTAYGNSTLGKDWYDKNKDGQKTSDEITLNQRGNSTVLYKMMQYAKKVVDPSFGDTLPSDSIAQFERHFKLVYPKPSDPKKSYGGAFGIVSIFEVMY